MKELELKEGQKYNLKKKKSWTVTIDKNDVMIATKCGKMYDPDIFRGIFEMTNNPQEGEQQERK